jgi:hypothetical protein
MKTGLNTILLVAAVAVAALPAHAATVLDTRLNPANGHTYHLLSPAGWVESENAALALGGHLVTIDDAAENAFVATNFTGFGGVNRFLWMGLHDPNPYTNAIFTSGRAAEFVWLNGASVTYSNWGPSQPSTSRPTDPEMRVVMDHSGVGLAGRWSDVEYRLGPAWDGAAIDWTGDPVCGVVEVDPAATPPPEPRIVVDAPPTQTEAFTATARLRVDVVSATPLTFQWFKGGAPLENGTNMYLRLENAQAADAGAYHLVATNASGAVTSGVVVLTVAALPIVAGPRLDETNGHIYYLLAPAPWTVAEAAAVALGGHLATINDEAENTMVRAWASPFTGNRSLWIGLVDTNPTVNATNYLERRSEFGWISGEPVTYHNWDDGQPDNYHYLDYGDELYGEIWGGNRWNDLANENLDRGAGVFGLVELDGQFAPRFVLQPASRLVAVSNSVTFFVSAGGERPVAYQWYHDGGLIEGATATNYSLAKALVADAGEYFVVASNRFGASTSAVVTLTVGLPPAPVSAPVSNLTVAVGESFTLHAQATGTLPIWYQWRHNNILFSNQMVHASNAAVTVENAQLTNAGTYTFTLTNLFGSSGSRRGTSAVVNVVGEGILTQPSDQNRRIGESATFRVVAAGNVTGYQWFFEDSPLVNATSATLVLNTVQLADAGDYQVVVHYAASSVTSRVATLAVDPRPYIVQQPESVTLPAGADAVFQVVALGAPPLSYQWHSVSQGALPEATNAMLLLPGAQVDDTFFVEITNAFGMLASDPATLTILGGPVDTDGDGLPDDWEIAHGFDPNTPGESELDTDSDGLNNAQEYLAGTDPRDPASVLRLEIAVTAGAVSLHFLAVSNRTYTVLGRNSLSAADWLRVRDVDTRATNRVERFTDAPGNGLFRVYRVVTPSVSLP